MFTKKASEVNLNRMASANYIQTKKSTTPLSFYFSMCPMKTQT